MAAARNAYDNGAPVPQVQDWLGHATIETTMRYAGTDEGNGGGAVDFEVQQRRRGVKRFAD